MIKLLKPYKDHKKGEVIDLGCVINKSLIRKGIAQSLKMVEPKIRVK